MSDDFEEYLRAARPAEPPPELMRRLRHAEPASGGIALRWRRWTPLAAIAVATMILLAMVVGSHRLLTEDPAAAKRQRTVLREDVSADDEPRSFGGSVALNIQLGASPDLIPVSLRPNYDPRAPHSPAGLLVANPISESAPRF